MESIMMQDDSVLSWNTAMLLYNSALKEMGTKIEIPACASVQSD